MSLTQRTPEIFDGVNLDGTQSEHGTRIVIQNLRGRWGTSAALRAYNDIARLQPLVPARDFATPEAGDEFTIDFWQDDVALPFQTDFVRRLRILFEDRAVLTVDGLFGGESGELVLEINGDLIEMDIDDPALAGLHVYKNYFANRDDPRDTSLIECGPFSFSFFVFDLSRTSPSQFRLDPDEKRLVKEHRIYLYRDGVRVLPYGDAEDDWLQLDVIRGTQGAKWILSNDQTVGFVHITHADNPNLRDKTNREGLLDGGDSYNDFVAVLQTHRGLCPCKTVRPLLDGKRTTARNRSKATERHRLRAAGAYGQCDAAQDAEGICQKDCPLTRGRTCLHEDAC